MILGEPLTILERHARPNEVPTMPSVLLLSDDLLDASRIAGHGRAIGLTVTQCRDTKTLLAQLEKQPACVVLDLHNPSLELDSFVAEAKAKGATRLIGFGSHVDVTRLKAARQAGCEEVLPRSAFFDKLEERMREW